MGGGHSWREGWWVKASERERKEGRTGEREGRGVQSWRGGERERGKEFQSWGEGEGGIIDGRERGVRVIVGEREGGSKLGRERGEFKS